MTTTVRKVSLPGRLCRVISAMAGVPVVRIGWSSFAAGGMNTTEARR